MNTSNNISKIRERPELSNRFRTFVEVHTLGMNEAEPREEEETQ